MNVSLIEMAAFLATPEAQALATDAEKIAAAQRWKAELAATVQNDIPAFDPVEYLERLSLERLEWVNSSGHPVDRVAEALTQIDNEIAKYA